MQSISLPYFRPRHSKAMGAYADHHRNGLDCQPVAAIAG